MPDSETHREAKRVKQAQRNAGRQRIRQRMRSPYALAWEDSQDRRCTGCGKWLHEGQVSGYGGRSVYGRLRWCEGCHVSAELKRASFRLLTLAQPTTLSGAA